MLFIDLKSQFDQFNLNLNIDLPSDQIIGLFGPSGSGKTRLLRQLIGFDHSNITSAVIKFNQSIWHDSRHHQYQASHRRGIGYLPQNIDLFPHLTIKENIHFNNSITAQNNNVLQHKSKIYQQLDIIPLLEKKPHQLSGGQQQRVALARAIFSASNLLVLDEPFSAIGEDHKISAMQLLFFIHQELNLPIIFSSHDRFEHAYLTQYLVTFDQGLVQQMGSYQAISTDIRGKFCQFTDAINRLSAKVVLFDEEFSINQLTTDKHQLWAGNTALGANSHVRLEIKAQDISLFLEASSQSSILNTMAVTIVEFEEISNHQIAVKLSFEQSFLVAFITKKSFHELNLKVEQNLFAKFKSVSVSPISFVPNK